MILNNISLSFLILEVPFVPSEQEGRFPHICFAYELNEWVDETRLSVVNDDLSVLELHNFPI